MMSSLRFLFCLVILVQAMNAWAAKKIPDELQTTIVRLYSEDRCDGVRAIATEIDLTLLRPNVMAVAAYCDPVGKDPEVLFARAEALSPTGDLILVLHGKWEWKHHREKSHAIWEKVLMIARNDYFRSIAKEYLADVVTEASNNQPMDLSPTTEFIRLDVNGIHRLHPQPLELSFLHTNPSNGVSLDAFFSKRKWFPTGSLSLRYETSYDQFVQASEFNQWTNHLESAVALHVASSKDIILTPFIDYRTLGGTPFDFNYGLGMTGAVYRGDYVQSVKALIYTQHIFKSPISAEEGAHYRFEYAWDFYPMLWLITTQFAIDHTSSDPTTSFLGSNGNFEHSNNRFILNCKVERELSRFTFSVDPSISYRLNTDSSSFSRPSDGVVVNVKEEDIEYHVKASVSIPLVKSIKLYAWYEWAHISSNLDENAYVDRNLTDQTVGVGVRTYLSSY